MTLKQLFIAGTASCLIGCIGSARAADEWVAAYTDALSHAHIADARAAANAAAQASPGDGTARFAVGTADFLGAIETFGRTMYRYGLRPAYSSSFTGGLPFISLPIAENPKPEPVNYQKLRDALAALSDGLDAAEAELAAVPAGPIALQLDLVQVHLDMDGNGNAVDDPSLLMLTALLGGGPAIAPIVRDTKSLPVDLDESDVLWLRAYCNLLGAMADFMLGYDWHEGYDNSFYRLFPSGEYPPSAAIEQMRADTKRLTELGGPMSLSIFSSPARANPGDPQAERQAIQQRLDWGGIADLLAFIHTARWPVADAARLKAVHAHLKAMVALSRAEWKSILAETDTDSNELLPNPRQHGVIPNMRIEQARVDGWMTLLDQLDGLLDGTILVPHWRFDRGVNLKRFLLEPTTFDPVMLFQGQAATPYLEDGPKADSAVWNRITSVFGGNFLQYFFWIN